MMKSNYTKENYTHEKSNGKCEYIKCFILKMNKSFLIYFLQEAPNNIQFTDF